jgi:hypothetical protein
MRKSYFQKKTWNTKINALRLCVFYLGDFRCSPLGGQFSLSAISVSQCITDLPIKLNRLSSHNSLMLLVKVVGAQGFEPWTR